MANASSFVRVTSTPADGRRPLVGPHGEEPATGPVAAAEVGDGDGAQREHDHDEHREAEGVGQAASRSRRRGRGRRVSARGPVRRRPGQVGELGVLEVELLEHHRRGHRDDGELHAADAQGREADEQPDDRRRRPCRRGRRGSSAEARARPRRTPAAPSTLAVAHQPDRHERGRAGERQLGQADLAHVARRARRS